MWAASTSIWRSTLANYPKGIGMLLQTGRYQKGEKDFQLLVTVDLQDGEQPVLVEVDFLAPDEPKLKKNKPKLLPNFRILQFSACTAAFMSPQRVKISGRTLTGALNEVELMVASTAGLLIMKAYAVKNRSKAKDVYDICHCLEHDPGGIAALAKDWFRHKEDPLVLEAVCCFREKFQSIDFYGPRQLAEFHGYDNEEERDFHARRAYELVQEFLRQWDSLSSFEE